MNRIREKQAGKANLVVARHRNRHVQAILDAARLLRHELLLHALGEQALASLMQKLNSYTAFSHKYE